MHFLSWKMLYFAVKNVVRKFQESYKNDTRAALWRGASATLLCPAEKADTRKTIENGDTRAKRLKRSRASGKKSAARGRRRGVGKGTRPMLALALFIASSSKSPNSSKFILNVNFRQLVFGCIKTKLSNTRIISKFATMFKRYTIILVA